MENNSSDTNSTSNNNNNDSNNNNKDNSENELVLLICVITLVILIILGVYVYINRQSFGLGSTGWKIKSFEPPKERELYNEAKSKLDPSNPANLEELKKLLMRRAMYTIPLILTLQNSGTSVQRLYNRGMLTDDVYENVKEMKAFVDVEFSEVQIEAEDLIPGWGPHIWPEAMRFHQMIQEHNQQKIKQEELPERTSEEKRKAAAEQRRQKTLALQRERDLKKKEEDAEKIAQQLIEEEEREKNSKSKKKN